MRLLRNFRDNFSSAPLQSKINIVARGISAAWFFSTVCIELSALEDIQQVGSSLFFLTTQQLIFLCAWNSYKTKKAIDALADEPNENSQGVNTEIKEEPALSKFNWLGGVILADSLLVSVLWTALLRSNLYISLLYHVSPTVIQIIVEHITKSIDAYIINGKDFGKKVACFTLYLSGEVLATVAFTYAGLKNPDNGKNSVYPGITDWDTSPGTATFYGVTIPVLSPPIMLQLVHTIMKASHCKTRPAINDGPAPTANNKCRLIVSKMGDNIKWGLPESDRNIRAPLLG